MTVPGEREEHFCSKDRLSASHTLIILIKGALCC